MSKGVTFIGSLIVDIIKMIDLYPNPAALCNIGEISQCIGGLAANTSIDLKVLDPSLDIHVMGIVGNDERGVYLKEMLSSYNIDISGIQTHLSLPTSFTDVMTEISTGTRTFFQHQGACADYGYRNIHFDAIKTSHVHLGYVLLMKQFDALDKEYGTVMARILKKLSDRGLQTSIDLVSDASGRYQQVVPPALQYTDVLFINEVEAAGTVGYTLCDQNGKLDQQLIKKACEDLLSYGVRRMVVLHASTGSWVMEKNNNFSFCPSIDLPDDYIKGSVGAGDAFCAGMLYALVHSLPIEEGQRIANLAAAASLSCYDSIGGLRPLVELMADPVLNMQLKNGFALPHPNSCHS